MSIEVTDALEEKRKVVERAKSFAKALEDGNQALVECFANLAEAARDSAAVGGYEETKECLDLISRLSDIGYTSAE